VEETYSLGSSKVDPSLPMCAESTRRDGRNAGLFELAGGLDRCLGTRIGDLAQRCHDLDGYPSALGAGDQSREHLFVLSADLPVGDTLADLPAQLGLGCTFHFGLGLRGGPTRGRGCCVLRLAVGAQRKRKVSGEGWRRSGGSSFDRPTVSTGPCSIRSATEPCHTPISPGPE